MLLTQLLLESPTYDIVINQTTYRILYSGGSANYTHVYIKISLVDTSILVYIAVQRLYIKIQYTVEYMYLYS